MRSRSEAQSTMITEMNAWPSKASEVELDEHFGPHHRALGMALLNLENNDISDLLSRAAAPLSSTIEKSP